METLSELGARFAELVGPQNVSSDAQELACASTATFAWDRRVSLIVRPGSSEEVRSCLLEAARARVAIYPVSRGRNWGLGSRAPLGDGWILLDLARMNQILDLDREMATVTVEPGVTFQQLYEFLKANAPDLFAPVPGTVPDASVIGHALERGDAIGWNADRCAHVCALEIVVPDGRCVRTGFDRFEATDLGPLDRYGVGPALQDLAFQSNLGVVTRMTLWLSPKPKSFAAVLLKLRDTTALAAVSEAVRTLRFEGVLRAGGAILNDVRAMANAAARDHGEVETALRTARWGRALQAPTWIRWYGTLPFFAPSEALTRACIDHAVEVLAEHGVPNDAVTVSDDAVPLFFGQPSEYALRSVLGSCGFAQGGGSSAAELADCGILWCPVAVPLRGRDVAAAVDLADRVLIEHDFAPSNAVLFVRDRIAYMTPAVLYNRTLPGADERAMRCHDALLEALQGKGYLLFRVGIQAADRVCPSRDDTPSVLRTLKRALDPSGVLAPGRYEFGDRNARSPS